MELFYDDSKKIGVGLIIIGLVFYTLGILFFLDRGFLCIGNLSFIMGLVVVVGPQNTVSFFARKGKIVGSAVFFAGFIMIIIGWFLFTTLGFMMQCYGLFLLFRDFTRVIFSYMQTLPVVGPVLRNSPFAHTVVDSIAGSTKGQGGASQRKKFEV